MALTRITSSVIKDSTITEGKFDTQYLNATGTPDTGNQPITLESTLNIRVGTGADYFSASGNKLTLNAPSGNLNALEVGLGGVTLTSGNFTLSDNSTQISTPRLKVNNGTVTVPSLKLQEAPLLEGNYVGFAPPLSVTANTLWTLPDGDGTSAQALSTNGSGILSWTSYLPAQNPSTIGVVSVKPVHAASPGKIAFYENQGTNLVSLQAHSSLAADYSLYLPTSDGTSGQALVTDGSGNLSFSTVSGGSSSNSTLIVYGGRVQHSTSFDNRMIICGGIYGPTYYIWSSAAGVTASSGGTVDTTTFTLPGSYQHYGSIIVPSTGQVKVDFLAKPLNSSSYSKPYVMQLWEFTPTIGTTSGPTCTLRAKVNMTSSSSASYASATMTSTSDITAGKYVFVTIGMDAQTLTTTAYQYMNINVTLLA